VVADGRSVGPEVRDAVVAGDGVLHRQEPRQVVEVDEAAERRPELVLRAVVMAWAKARKALTSATSSLVRSCAVRNSTLVSAGQASL
jgi:hypothetical protein